MQKQTEKWTWRQWGRFAQGMISANLIAALLLQIAIHLARNDQGAYSYAATVFIPLLLGFVSAYFWRDLKPKSRQLFLWSLLNTLIALACSAIFLKEGVICLVMASPLLLTMVYAGACMGNRVFRDESRPLRVSVAPVLLAMMALDCFQRHTYRTLVTTTMRVEAPPSAVYPYIIAFPKIQQPSRFWLCDAGLPYPVETTVGGRYVGAKRTCRFSGGIAIGEKITRLVPNREIDFDVTEMPRYPEIADHATLEQGRIALRDNGDGTTTLVGTSWYALRVFPSWYFGPWSDYLIHEVHSRVFEQIKAEAESHGPSRVTGRGRDR